MSSCGLTNSCCTFVLPALEGFSLPSRGIGAGLRHQRHQRASIRLPPPGFSATPVQHTCFRKVFAARGLAPSPFTGADRGRYCVRLGPRHLSSPLMGEGSGGGERIALLPPSCPSPTRGEGTLPPLSVLRGRAGVGVNTGGAEITDVPPFPPSPARGQGAQAQGQDPAPISIDTASHFP
jgi:hypothetical protein